MSWVSISLIGYFSSQGPFLDSSVFSPSTKLRSPWLANLSIAIRSGNRDPPNPADHVLTEQENGSPIRCWNTGEKLKTRHLADESHCIISRTMRWALMTTRRKLCNGHGNDGNCEFELVQLVYDGQRKPAACLTEHATKSRWSKLGCRYHLSNTNLYGFDETCHVWMLQK